MGVKKIRIEHGSMKTNNKINNFLIFKLIYFVITV